MSYIPAAVLPQYSTVTLPIGMKERLRCLHISDTHLLFSDGRDCRVKYDVALRRWGEYVYANVGRNVTYFWMRSFTRNGTVSCCSIPGI